MTEYSRKFFECIKPVPFLLKYCNFKSVGRIRHKINGIDGNGQPIDFTEEEKKKMKAALRMILKDLS
jgi:hypothetical protein